jgi:hypothetical protein
LKKPALALLSILAFAGSAQAQSRVAPVEAYRLQGPSMTLYSGPNFTGRSVTFGSSVRNLNDAGFNDLAMSARVRGIWKICEDRDYRSRCEWVDGDIRDLGWVDMNRKISSAVLSDSGPEDSNGNRPYGSDDRDGRGYGDHRDPGQPGYGQHQYDNSPSSPRGGYSSDPRRGDYGRPYSDYDSGLGRPVYGRVVLYSGPGFTGRQLVLDQAISDLAGVQFNDLAMSLRVEGEWSLCKDRDYRSTCVIVDRDISNLRPDLSRAISSARPVTR